jgi:hypothetical protein
MDERPIQLLDRLAPEVDVAAARRVFEARARLERRRRRLASGGSAMVALLLLFVGVRSLTTRDPGHVLVQPLGPTSTVASEPLPLVGTRWELVGVRDGDRSPPVIRGPFLQIASDGTIAAWTGIDVLRGRLAGTDGGSRHIESLTRGREGGAFVDYTEEGAAIAGPIDAVFSHDFSLAIDGTTLTISDPYGHVVRYSGIASLLPLPAGTLGDEPTPSTTLPRPG